MGSGLPEVLLCFKTEKKQEKGGKRDDKDVKKDSGNKIKKRSKSRELRNGILYIGCDCERRNGLQDSCPRTGCQGNPECMTIPPTCAPSEFANAKHIVKKMEKIMKEREMYARKGNKNKSAAKGANNNCNKQLEALTDYECVPLDGMLEIGLPCPVCERTMDKSSNCKPNQNLNILPIIIDFPKSSCCAGAS